MKSKREIKKQVKFEIIETVTRMSDDFCDTYLGESLSDKEFTIALKELKYQAQRIVRFLNYPPR